MLVLPALSFVVVGEYLVWARGGWFWFSWFVRCFLVYGGGWVLVCFLLFGEILVFFCLFLWGVGLGSWEFVGTGRM